MASPLVTAASRWRALGAWLASDLTTTRWVLVVGYLGLLVPLLAYDCRFWRSWPLGIPPYAVYCLHWVTIVQMILAPPLFVVSAGTTELCPPIPPARLWLPVCIAATGVNQAIWAATMSLNQLFNASSVTHALPIFAIQAVSWVLCSALLFSLSRNRGGAIRCSGDCPGS